MPYSIEELREKYDLLDFEKESEHIYSVTPANETGMALFTFDQKKIYNLWEDYPKNFSKKEIEIFNKEIPYWADFFSNRLHK